MLGPLLALGLAALPAAAPAALAPVAAPADDPSLRVVTAPVEPFVLTQAEPPAGFSIDLWTEIARRLHRDFTWRRVSIDELVPLVARGEADVAIAAVTMTPERETQVDFAYPYFESGLQIMAHADRDSRLDVVLQSVPWPVLGQFVLVALVVMIVLAHVLWVIDRRNNPLLQKPYPLVIGEALWGIVLIVATGEYGDRTAPGFVKRLAVSSMWLLGMIMVAQLTATVTSSQTVARLHSSIRGPDDLHGKRVATVKGTVAEEYLASVGIKPLNCASIEEAVDRLVGGQADAIVFASPTLRYWAKKRRPDDVDVVGPVFRPERFGIAVQQGSPLRERIDEALLGMYDDGTYDEIHSRWFAATN